MHGDILFLKPVWKGLLQIELAKSISKSISFEANYHSQAWTYNAVHEEAGRSPKDDP